MSRWLVPLAVGTYCLSAPVTFASQVTPYIIDGTPASQSDWPYIAALVKKNQSAYDGQFCGGSLIKDRYVLTAAHCVDDLVKEGLDVIVGINNLNNSPNEGYRVSVKSVIVHPFYNSSTLDNDIAVLELERAVSSNEAVPVSLAAADSRQATADGTSLKVAGWGSTTPDYGDHTTPAILQEVIVPLVNQTTCSQTMNGVEDSILATSFCAGTTNEGFDSCRGDSGGPIIVENTGIQLGLVSWGNRRCGEQNSYGVYTNLSQYQSWIATVLNGLSYVSYEHIGYFNLGTHSHTVKFTNYDSEPVNFSQSAWAYSNSIETADVINNTCLTKGTLLTNESCSMTVRFNLLSYGTKTFYTQMQYTKGSDPSYGLSQVIEVEAAVRGDASLADALGVSNVTIYADDNPWILYGSNGVRSAAIGHSQQSTLILEGVAAGEYKLDVQLSTEASADELYLYINGDTQGGVSGETAFTYDLSLTRELNQVKFVYSKDSSIASGDDAAYISNFRKVDDSANSGTSSSGGGSLGWFSLLLLFVAARRR
ncbi:trypsin-like serine protease [Vibrio sp. NH-UV-68]|uniref:S1 family peptidase n=1 Tax=unclassified Vibrio TaxID=2614977 RepID=UPI0036F2F105